MNLYHQTLIDHYRNPRHRGTLQHADFSWQSYNPSCGDSVSWQGCIDQEIISAIAFKGFGCVISQALASIIAEWVQGKSIDILLKINKEDLIAMANLDLGPVRLKCALLPLYALQEGVRNYQHAGS